MNRFRTILLISGVLLVAAAIAGVAQPQFGRSANSSTGSTITVTANGTVDATPDRASFDFGVTTNGATAAEALSRNSSEAQAIIDALKKAGVSSSDIQTTQVSLWPQTSSNGLKITGYQASNSVNVSAPLAKSGSLVDSAVGAGANNVDGPNLAADTTSLYNQALTQALSKSKAKALVIADATGLTLGKVLKVNESGAPTPIVYGAALAESAKAAPPIEAGTQKIEASVTVTYSAG